MPLVHQGKLIGVWDVDSPVPDRFDEDGQQVDQRGVHVVDAAAQLRQRLLAERGGPARHPLGVEQGRLVLGVEERAPDRKSVV